MKHCTKTVYFVTNVYACVNIRVYALVYVCPCNVEVCTCMIVCSALRTIFLFKLTGKCLTSKTGGEGGGIGGSVIEAYRWIEI